MSERLRRLINDWRERAKLQPAEYLSPIPRCCAEEIEGCADELADEVALDKDSRMVLSDEIYELSQALRRARDDFRDARDGETAARFDAFADEALELSKLALRAADAPRAHPSESEDERANRIVAQAAAIDAKLRLKYGIIEKENEELRAELAALKAVSRPHPETPSATKEQS